MDLYFYSYRWRTIWRRQYAQYKADFKDKIQKLFENLDDESIKTANSLLTSNLETSHFGLIKDMIKSYVDFKVSSSQNPNRTIKSKYILGNKTKPDFYLLAYKNGFSYIEDAYSMYVSGKDFIDGGAYVGDSAVVLNELNPKSIHCFEPNKKNYDFLKKTIELNNLDDIVFAKELGLSDECTSIFFKGSSVRARVSQAETKNQVDVMTIDKYVEDNNLNIGLIKLDVESLEYNVILGAEKTIKTQKPVLLISIYHTLKDFLEIKPLIESFSDDYSFMIKPSHCYSLNLEFMLIAVPK